MVVTTMPHIPLQAVQPHWGTACFVDVETTGLTNGDEIVELAMVLFAYDNDAGTILGIIDEYTGLRQPSFPIPPEATRIHGITNAMARGRQLDMAHVEWMIDQAGFLIAHNAPFDRRFLCAISVVAREKPWRCSMTGVDWYGKGHESRALQSLLTAHRIKPGNAHRALADVQAAITLLTCVDQATGKTYFHELLNKPASKWSGNKERQRGYAPEAVGEVAAAVHHTPPKTKNDPKQVGRGCTLMLVGLVAVLFLISRSFSGTRRSAGPDDTTGVSAGPVVDVARSDELKAYLDVNFSKPEPVPFYTRIQGVRVHSDGTVAVETNLSASEARTDGLSICDAIHNAPVGKEKLGRITVLDKNGKRFDPPGERFDERCNR